MGTVLKKVKKRILPIAMIFSIWLILSGSTSLEKPLLYGPVAGYITAYAMGAEYSSLGAITPGIFANHSYTYCPNYSPSRWPAGTKITLPEIIYIPSRYDDYPHTFSSFYKRDIGDINCSEGEYWADLYFGRYRNIGDYCVCSGVINSVCLDGNTNSCTNATNWGRNWYSYYFFTP